MGSTPPLSHRLWRQWVGPLIWQVAASAVLTVPPSFQLHMSSLQLLGLLGTPRSEGGQWKSASWLHWHIVSVPIVWIHLLYRAMECPECAVARGRAVNIAGEGHTWPTCPSPAGVLSSSNIWKGIYNWAYLWSLNKYTEANTVFKPKG